MKVYEPGAGENIMETALAICQMASASGCTVEAKFNDIILSAEPSSKPEGITRFYDEECDRRHKAYIESDEYKERERERKEAAEKEAFLRQEALKESPDEPTWRDQDGWNKSVEANKNDGYSNAVMTFAHRWARLMEGKINKGATVAQCANSMASLADEEGISGFMYGCAVSILSKTWKHGEDLRRWHNHETQIGDEGDKANESGGVLNPALLNIGVKEKG